MLKVLLLTAALCVMFNACNGYDKQNTRSYYDYDWIDLIVVSKTPKGAYAEGNDWANKVLPKFRHIGWYEIGLSRNGKEPIEYIWRLEKGPPYYGIRYAEIGDKGTVHLEYWAKKNNVKLPQPNAENPPTIGIFGDVFWVRNYDGIEVIIVNKIPRGIFADEELPPELSNIGWHDIGLSRNGKEPVEYIWRAGQEPYNYFIMLAEIGDRGAIHLDELAKLRNIKLPQPNAKKPPIIGVLGEVYWEKRE